MLIRCISGCSTCLTRKLLVLMFHLFLVFCSTIKTSQLKFYIFTYLFGNCPSESAFKGVPTSKIFRLKSLLLYSYKQNTEKIHVLNHFGVMVLSNPLHYCLKL